MNRAYYSDSISTFLTSEVDQILGKLVLNSVFSVDPTQRDAWIEQIQILKAVLPPYREQGTVYFEYSVPRLGKRIDVIVVTGPVIFILEFKIGEKEFTSSAIDQ